MLKDHKKQVKVRLKLNRIPFWLNSTCSCSQDREKKVSKFEQSGLTEEELLRKQEELFAASRKRFEQNQQ